MTEESPQLTPTLMEQVCADIRQGCHPHVAARRHDINHWDFFVWNKRGEREAQNREPTEPPSKFEQFYHAVQHAQADARYTAESKVHKTAPLAWLKLGYARADWRESDALVRAVEDAIEAKFREREEAQAASGSRDRPIISQEQLVRILNDLLEVEAFNRAPVQETQTPTPVERSSQNGNVTPVPPV